LCNSLFSHIIYPSFRAYPFEKPIRYSIVKEPHHETTLNQPAMTGASPPGKSCPHGVRGGVSDDQRPLLIEGLFRSDMLDAVLPVRSEKVKTQTVLLRVDLIDQFLA